MAALAKESTAKWPWPFEKRAPWSLEPVGQVLAPRRTPTAAIQPQLQLRKLRWPKSHSQGRFLMTWDGDEVDPWPGKRGLGHVMTPVMACDGFMMLIDAYRLCYNNARIYIILYYCIISLLLLLLYIDIRSCRVAVLKGGTSKPMVGSHVSCMFVLAQCL